MVTSQESGEYERFSMSLELRRLSKSLETNELAPVPAQEHIHGAPKERCHLARSTSGCPFKTVHAEQLFG